MSYRLNVLPSEMQLLSHASLIQSGNFNNEIEWIRSKICSLNRTPSVETKLASGFENKFHSRRTLYKKYVLYYTNVWNVMMTALSEFVFLNVLNLVVPCHPF